MKRIFVDGSSGTTGLQIHERLSRYKDIEIISIDYEKRRDPKERAKCLNNADLVFLCLPDDAALEACTMISNPDTKVIDASCAHRVAPGWTYGLPELSRSQREAIISSKRVANPGCHATAFILSIYPLIASEVMPKDYPVSAQSLTGYSGGGKSLIEKYESNNGKNDYIKAPRPYSLSLNHKHLPEMTVYSGLREAPVFVPVIGNNYKGLAVMVPIHTALLSKKVDGRAIHELLSDYYKDEKFVKVMPYEDDAALFEGAVDITACNDTNKAEIFVFGNAARESALIITRIDNLGKGASGAAIQNMNLMLGYDEDYNLI